jgi:type IV secretory pathway VirB2 component (pilin)
MHSKIFKQRLSRVLPFMVFCLAVPLHAQTAGDPISDVISRVALAFTGPIAQGLALIGLCYGGAQLLWGNGQGRGGLIGMVLGCTVMLGAGQIRAWLF